MTADNSATTWFIRVRRSRSVRSVAPASARVFLHFDDEFSAFELGLQSFVLAAQAGNLLSLGIGFAHAFAVLVRSGHAEPAADAIW